MFKSKKVVEFLNTFDDYCQIELGSVFDHFKIHAEPIIVTPDMHTFISQASAIFGDYWDLTCELRGVKKNQLAFCIFLRY